jgi:chromosome segregation and condensation protein ScpB
MFSNFIRTLPLLILITNFLACGDKKPQGDGMEKPIADAFLKLINNGKTEEAWDSTSVEFKSYMGKAQFQSTVTMNPFLKKALTFDKTEKDAQSKVLTYCSYKEAISKKTIVVIVGPDQDAVRVQGMKIE